MGDILYILQVALMIFIGIFVGRYIAIYLWFWKEKRNAPCVFEAELNKHYAIFCPTIKEATQFLTSCKIRKDGKEVKLMRRYGGFLILNGGRMAMHDALTNHGYPVTSYSPMLDAYITDT